MCNQIPSYSFQPASCPSCERGRRTRASSQTSLPSTFSWCHSWNVKKALCVFLLVLNLVSTQRQRWNLHFIGGLCRFGHPVASLQGAVEHLIHRQVRVWGSTCGECENCWRNDPNGNNFKNIKTSVNFFPESRVSLMWWKWWGLPSHKDSAEFVCNAQGDLIITCYKLINKRFHLFP